MTLKEDIDDIRNQLKQGAFKSESAVSVGIVLKLLNTLGWPNKPQIIIPEYGVKRQRVDFALCHQPERPRVFIEVKQVGNLDGAEEQLSGYASHEGVPIAILTDGQKWRFFHPTGEGKFRERKVYELDLIEADSEEGVKRLNRYLNYEGVRKGDAVTAIKNDYQEVSKQREIEARLPELWNELLQEKNDYLLLAMMEKSKEKVGHEPTAEQVLAFLNSLRSKPGLEPVVPSTSRYKTRTAPNSTRSPSKSSKPQTRLHVTMSDGDVIEYADGIDTFVEVIEKLGIERVKDLNIIRNSIPLISTVKDPERGQHQRGRYYIVSGLSTQNKKSTLDRIAKELEIDLKVEIVDK